MDSGNLLGDCNDDFYGMSGDSVQGNESGPVLVAIESVRREVNARLDGLKHEVSLISRAQNRSNADDLSEEVRAGLSAIKTLAEELAGKGTTDAKPRRSPRQTLMLLPYAAGFERAISPLLTWSIIATVVSFVRKFPCL